MNGIVREELGLACGMHRLLDFGFLAFLLCIGILGHSDPMDVTEGNLNLFSLEVKRVILINLPFLTMPATLMICLASEVSKMVVSS